MSAVEEYRRQLQQLETWEPFLLEHSGLPGPRGNLELAQAVAEEGRAELFESYRSYTAEQAPVNCPKEFIVFCGVLGLGRLIAEGGLDQLQSLRPFASDTRWRIREAVAMALQRVGDTDMPALVREMRAWAKGNLYERRAAAAALCEPRLLKQVGPAMDTVSVLDEITASVLQVKDRRSEDFIALRKGLGYCWSVAVAALPEFGRQHLEKWLASPDRDIRWIMKQNLNKKRMQRVDAQWVEKWRRQLQD
jgi:hypothetical protein